MGAGSAARQPFAISKSAFMKKQAHTKISCRLKRERCIRDVKLSDSSYLNFA